jgi:hypothetical protein
MCEQGVGSSFIYLFAVDDFAVAVAEIQIETAISSSKPVCKAVRCNI